MFKNVSITPILIAIAFVAGMYVSKLGTEKQSIQNQPSYNNKLQELFSLIENHYAEDVDVEQIIEDLIPDVLARLDPHSSYIIPEVYSEIQDPIMGSFEGIGVQFNIQHDTIVVIQVIAGGPSQKVGILPGDRIIKVNDSIVAKIGITNNRVVKLLKGPKGTKVTVLVKRNGQAKPIEFVITRDVIPFYSIDAAYMLDNNTGYIKISRFAATTHEEFLKHIEELRALGMKNIIVDLRENGGGVLNTAIDLANEFLPKDALIVYTKGKAYEEQRQYANGKGSCKDLGMVVLVDEFSASASEVFAGAIQDNDRGYIVGRRSFGKGFVNRDFTFADSTIVRLTIQKFYSPSGRCIQKPYKNGVDEYNSELSERYAHGEMLSMDSISFPDSLKFKTKKGRTVYGGGGIMPEYFIPMDTLAYSEYYSALISKGILYDFAFSYSDNNRQKLKAFKTAKELYAYLDKTTIVKEMQTFAQKKGVPFNSAQFAISQKAIKNMLFAYIARNVLDDEAFYEIINMKDAAIKKSLEFIDNCGVSL